MGVQIFFVISGYLITSKLLLDKGKPFKEYISSFYVKRFLRIFPVYYLYLFICLLIFFLPILPEWIRKNFSEIKTNGVLLFTYTYNYMYPVNQYLGKSLQWQGFYAHLWSLSVEEQFYIFFPFIAFLLNRRQLKWILIGALFITPALRYIAYPFLASVNPQTWWIGGIFYKATFFQADALGTGALLALTAHWFNTKRSYLLLMISRLLLVMLE